MRHCNRWTSTWKRLSSFACVCLSCCDEYEKEENNIKRVRKGKSFVWCSESQGDCCGVFLLSFSLRLPNVQFFQTNECFIFLSHPSTHSLSARWYSIYVFWDLILRSSTVMYCCGPSHQTSYWKQTENIYNQCSISPWMSKCHILEMTSTCGAVFCSSTLN